MRVIDQLLEEYGESHKNDVNKTIHWICIPIIVFSLIGMLWSIPLRSANGWFNVGTVAIFLALLYYIRLSIPLFLGFTVLSLLILAGNNFLYTLLHHSSEKLLIISLLLFILSWIAQFYGHKIEGKKPSFLKDIQFLLIGPAWLLHAIYKKIGINI